VLGGRSRHRRLPFFHQCPPCLAVQISAVQQVAQVQPPVVDHVVLRLLVSDQLQLLHLPACFNEGAPSTAYSPHHFYVDPARCVDLRYRAALGQNPDLCVKLVNCTGSLRFHKAPAHLPPGPRSLVNGRKLPSFLDDRIEAAPSEARARARRARQMNMNTNTN